MKIFWAILGLFIAGSVGFLAMRRNAPPELPFAEVQTETIVDMLATNGKVEPVEWASVRAERAGKLVTLIAEKGKSIRAGATVAVQETAEFQSLLSGAEARMKQAQAELDLILAGGRPAELAQIDGALRKSNLELANSQKELDALQRLESKNAIPKYEVTKARELVANLEQEIRTLQSRRGSLIAPSDRKAAEGRVQEARAAIEQTRQRAGQGVLTAPISGVVYQVDPKVGAYLNPGDLLVNIGRMDRLKVSVYVDEPELGRVAIGMPVSITWDARQGQEWIGEVNRLPLQIVQLQSRQVGEVIVLIDNPKGDLVQGANINAFLRSRVAENALAIPKEAIRKENGVTGVYAFDDGKLKWRPVKIGVSNITRAQVLEGLKAKDRVVIAIDKPLKDGMPALAVNEAK